MLDPKDVEPRGIPPYTVWGTALTDIPAHKGVAKDFEQALRMIFDLINGGEKHDYDWIIAYEYIADSTGMKVFTMDDSEDVKLLQQMNEKP